MITGSGPLDRRAVRQQHAIFHRLGDRTAGGSGQRLRHQSHCRFLQQVSLCLRGQTGYSQSERFARQARSTFSISAVPTIWRLQLALKEWGLKLSDIQVIVGGDAPTRLGSLMAGRMDATILSPPHLTIAVKSGYRVFADMGDMSANFPQSTLNVKGSYMRENRDLVKRFLRSYAEAIHVIKTDPRTNHEDFRQTHGHRRSSDGQFDLRLFCAALFISAAGEFGAACATRSISTPSKTPNSKTTKRKSSSTHSIARRIGEGRVF